MASSFYRDINTGQTFSLRLTTKDYDGTTINMNGYTARGQLKFRYGESGLIKDLAPAVYSGESPGYDATGSGILDIDLTAAETAALPVVQGKYDVEIYNVGGTVYRVLEGKANIHPEITN